MRRLPTTTSGFRRGIGGAILTWLTWILFAQISVDASSQIIAIDFGPLPQSGVPDPKWNYVTETETNSLTLVDFDTENVTAVSLSTSQFNSLGDAEGVAWLAAADWVSEEAGQDGFVVFGGSDPLNPLTGTVTLNGLNDLSTYRVEVVAAWSDPEPSIATFFDGSDYMVNGAFTDQTFREPVLPGNVGLDWSPSMANTMQDWMIWQDVTSTGGQITIGVTPSEASNFGILNAIRITRTAVPEPSAPVLVLISLAWFLRRKRGEGRKLIK